MHVRPKYRNLFPRIIVCKENFTQKIIAIVPQFKSGNKRLPNLNRKIYIMVATGSAQTDGMKMFSFYRDRIVDPLHILEINPHDLSRYIVDIIIYIVPATYIELLSRPLYFSTSHYYPILTSRSVNPAMVGEKLHPVPEEIKEETPTKAQNLEDNRTKFQGENGSGISSTMNLLMVLILVIGAIFFSTPINL
jgi:hypothetical protein